jgi:hypothetical protein
MFFVVVQSLRAKAASLILRAPSNWHRACTTRERVCSRIAVDKPVERAVAVAVVSSSET